MKKATSYIALSLLLSSSLFVACKKHITGRTDDVEALAPASTDINAGTWKMVLLTRPDTFAVATPAAVTSSSYIGELNEIKGFQADMSEDQKKQMKYWAAGGVLRWNEIMRELVAKHNLPPYQDENGVYPIPSSTNPFNYPTFPFSNPPYAARAYAYVSAAQYDALVACWYYKKLYNRPMPYKTDTAVKALAASTDLPSYPSEAAVMAGVTAEMMKLLFPTEIDVINLKAQEQENAAIMAGAATRSDVVAGEALGRQIAQAFIARAKGDNAGKAVGTQADWDALEKMNLDKGETPWYSLESPKRPPMLPLFGKVKPFLFDSATTVSLCPVPPPSTSSADMQADADEVLSYTKNPTAENIRIVQFWADGVGTYTPPGHWDAIAAEDFITKNYSEVRWARNMALLNMSMMDAAIECWYAKYHYCNPRPTQVNPKIKTLTGIPNFPSYISGHSTFSGAAATILGYLVPERASAYNDMAQEASFSRLAGGIHYKRDCQIGLDVGAKIGQYAITKAQNDGAGQ